MQHRLQQLGEAYREKKKSGADVSDLPDLENERTREALAEMYLTLGLALVSIIEWEGVLEGDEDKVAPVNEENITQFFKNYWVIAETFRQQYSGMRELLESEKNASRPACNGTATAGQSIAQTVPETTAPAPEVKKGKTGKNARTSKMH